MAFMNKIGSGANMTNALDVVANTVSIIQNVNGQSSVVDCANAFLAVASLGSTVASQSSIDAINASLNNINSEILTLAPLNSPHFTGTTTGITKTMVGLNNVDNVSDINKIVSTAQKSYVDTAVANLVASAPSTLNTLNELATALNDDPSFSTTITTLIGKKANSLSPSFSGTITNNGNFTIDASGNLTTVSGTITSNVLKAGTIDVGASLSNIQTTFAPLSSPSFTGTINNNGNFTIDASGNLTTTNGTITSNILKAGTIDVGASLSNIQTTFAPLLNPSFSGRLNKNSNFRLDALGNIIANNLTLSGTDTDTGGLTTTTLTATGNITCPDLKYNNGTSLISTIQTLRSGSGSASTLNLGTSTPYAFDQQARDNGGVQFGGLYRNGNIVQTCELMPAQYYYQYPEFVMSNVFTSGVFANNSTIEFWAYFNSIGGSQYILEINDPLHINTSILSIQLQSGNIGIQIGANVYYGSTLVVANQWTHLGFQFNNGNLYLLNNGKISLLTSSLPLVLVAPSINVWVGCQASTSNPPVNAMNGNISNLKISSIAQYYNINNWKQWYTPSYPLMLDTNTIALIQGSPFTNQANKSTTIVNVNTGSNVFKTIMMPAFGNNVPTTTQGAEDITSAYLYLPFPIPSLTAFTYEVYVNITKYSSSSSGLLDLEPINSGGLQSGRIYIYINNSGGLSVYIRDSATNYVLSTNTVPLNTWTHLAWVWTGTNIFCFINGVYQNQQQACSTTIGNTPYIMIGAAANDSTYGQDCLYGKISQPLLRNKVVYPSGSPFIPATDLTPSSTDTSVLFFMGYPNRVEQVSGQTFSSGGTVVDGSRTMA